MSKNLLLKRAHFKNQIRALLQERGVIEVDVPLLYPKVCPDRCVEPISLSLHGQKLYLQPSPELNLKKIVAKERIDCYSLNYAYRADSSSPIHHPEFLMLEFYLVGPRYEEIKSLTSEIIMLLCGTKAVHTRTYQEVWQDTLGVCYERSHKAFEALLVQNRIAFEPYWEKNLLEDLLFGAVIQPTLGQDCIDIIDGFPLHQSALAIEVGEDRAARYEVFIDGFEVANGYDELGGGELNAQRFRYWQRQRMQDGLDPCDPLDYDFFEAMDHLPQCCGVALGLDRIIMRALQCGHLTESMPFYWA